jgi:regulator of sigma E protease
MISLALALMNLLPLPALDGGRLVFITIGMIRRRPVDQKVEAVIHGVGMLLLLGLVLYATYGDIGRQIGKSRPVEPAAPASTTQPAPQAQSPAGAEASPAR